MEVTSLHAVPASKRTAIAGGLPPDWAEQTIGQFCTVKTGPFGTLLKASEYSEIDGVPVISVGEIREGYFRLTEHTPLVPEKVQKRLPQYILKAGDVVFGRKGAVERSALVRQPQAGWFLGSDGIAVRPTEEHCPEYIAAQFQSFRVRQWLASNSTGTTMASMNQGVLSRVAIPFPPAIAEERSIAEVLTDADVLIDSLEQLLTKKRQIKQGAMQELLTGKRRLPGFSGPWSNGVLGNVVAELVAGVSVNSEPSESGADVPSVVKTSAMKAGVFDPSECKPIIQADLARATTMLRKDTLLISRMNTPDLVGEVGYVDRNYDELFLPDRIWMTRMRSPDCVCVRWLGYLLSSAPYKRRIGDTATGTSGSMKNIAKSALLGILVSFPGVDEQQAIAQVLSDMDTEITALESRLTKARALKQAMAQALLTGRIRLVEHTA